MLLPRTRRENEIWQACNDLWAKGVPFSQLTRDAITMRLFELGYKKGSPNQIYQYRKSWADSRGIKEVSFEETPSVLSNPISRAAAFVREEILAEAEEKIMRAKKEGTEAIEEVNQKYEALGNEHQNLRIRFDELTQSYNDIKSQHFSLSDELIQERQKRAISEEKAQQAAQQLQQWQAETQRRFDEQKRFYEQQLNYVKEESQAIQLNDKKEIDALRDCLETKRQRHMVELDEKRVAYHKLEKQHEKILTTERTTQQWVTEFKQTLKRYEQEAAIQKNNSKKLATELQEKTKALLENTLTLKEAQIKEAEKKEQLQRYESNLSEAKERIERLEITLQQLSFALEKRVKRG
ncbi:MAG: hypothetical protein LEGION0398_MBIBDBAK_00554 [Legionellaceae bacterium]